MSEISNEKVNSDFDLLGNSKENFIKDWIKNSIRNEATKIRQSLISKYHLIEIDGSSMDNLLQHKDIVIGKEKTPFSKFKKDDIIEFINEDGIRVIHMIVNKYSKNGKTYYITKGLNNMFPDSNPITRENIISKVNLNKQDLSKVIKLAKQGRLTISTAYALNEHQRLLKTEFEIIISSYRNSKQSEIIKKTSDRFSNTLDIMDFYRSVCGNPRTELAGFRNILMAINEINSITGVSKRKLEIVKNELIGSICVQMLKNGLTLKGLGKLHLPSNLYGLCKNIWDYYDYNIRESFFIQKQMNGENVYQEEWLDSVNEQRKIQWKLSDGKDFYTGQKFIDLYKKYNPDGLSQSQLDSLTIEELETKAIKYTRRHHYRTDLPHNIRTLDSRVSATVLIWKFFEEQIHNDINSDPTLKNQKEQQYAKRFENTIKSLLKGEAPSYWFPQYRKNFNSQYDLGKSSIGIKYLFYLHLL